MQLASVLVISAIVVYVLNDLLAGRFTRMSYKAISFALQAEQSVRREIIGLGDIRALCPEMLGLYIAVDGSRGDSEAPIEY